MGLVRQMGCLRLSGAAVTGAFLVVLWLPDKLGRRPDCPHGWRLSRRRPQTYN
jgi:hypothetical protein